ncbi:HNH endonuclease [Streptomyces sp. NPDC048659]|uniref:HNH endonuclease n=1 Tax=Streptomyces sp. NPDC048659 TaxID=3155489 RepID=UPI003425FC44
MALLHAFGTLRTHQRRGVPSPHKPLSLLWSIARLEAGEDRLVPWEVFEHEVGGLLVEFGGPGSQVTPHYPFARLRGGIWEVEGIPDGVQDPSPTVLRAAGARAGFVPEAAKLLRTAHTRAAAVRLLTWTYFSEADRARILDRVGLVGYLSASGHTAEALDEEATPSGGAPGPVGRRRTTVTRPERNPEWPRQVKKWHESTCQVCGTPLETLLGRYSEAAHIQGIGSPHEGPDTTSNMLCLCPNHHKQFDLLGIYIDADWQVRRTADDTFVASLRRHPRHRIETAHVAYHRLLCGKAD